MTAYITTFILISGQVDDGLNSCFFSVLNYSTLALNFDHFNNSPRNAFKHELTLLERVRHPNVVQFVGAVTQNIPMMIVREYHSKVGLPSLFLCIFAKYSLFFAYINVDFQGDLASYLQKKGRLSPSKVLRFALDIARQVTISRNYPVRNLCERIFEKLSCPFLTSIISYMVGH